MMRKILMGVVGVLALAGVYWAQGQGMGMAGGAGGMGAMSPALNGAVIQQLTGLTGAMDAKEPVFKVSYPRNDLHVKAAGVTLTPPMGLTCWVAFTVVGNHCMIMGDTVLTEDQVNPVMSSALDNGLQVTALHNHFFWDEPKVYFMHIGGMGSQEDLARAVGKVYEVVKATAGGKGEVMRADIDPAKSTLDAKKINDVLGTSASVAGGVLKVTFGKTTQMDGGAMGNAMGVNTWAAFAGSDEKAAVMGDFAMYEGEVQGVLMALRKANIEVVAIHNHMAGETPRVVFLHYRGIGPTVDLAKGLKAALDTQGK